MVKQELELIPIETYKCPVCENELHCSLEEARKHVNVPLGTLIPIGTAFKLDSKCYYSKNHFYCDNVQSNHGYWQHFDLYKPNESYIGARLPDPDGTIWINTKDLKEKLKEGKTTLFTPKEAKKLSIDFHKCWKWFYKDVKIIIDTKKLLEEILSTP